MAKKNGAKIRALKNELRFISSMMDLADEQGDELEGEKLVDKWLATRQQLNNLRGIK